MSAALKRHVRSTGTANISITIPTEILEQIDTIADLDGQNRSSVSAIS